MKKDKFTKAYYFIIRVIQSCETIEQFEASRKLSWSFIDRDWSVFDNYVWSHLRVIAIELDAKRLALSNTLTP